MIKGIKTLEDIDEILHTVRNEITRIDQKIERLFEHSQENKQEQSKVTESLAKIYFNEIENKDFSQDNNSTIADDVESLLIKRADNYNNLLEDIENYNEQLASLELKRIEEHQLLDSAAKDVIEKEHEIQSMLEKDKEYQVELEKTRESKKISIEAENKADEAEQTRIIKGEPYEKDLLFSYLWRVKYGTSEYKERGLIKTLDSWVASLCDYEKHRVNYWTLLEIPKRLRLHAEVEKKAYHDNLERLSKIEHEYAQKVELSKYQEAEKKRQEIVDKIDDEILELEKKLNLAIEERQKFLEDKDKYAKEIIGKIDYLLRQMSLPDLNRLVKQTINKKDDKLAQNLNLLKSRAIKMQEDIDKHRKLYDEKLSQLHEIERLRVRFKNSRYDDIRSGFRDKNVIQDMLGGLLGGIIQSDILWDTLRRSQVHIDTGSWPDFGSGGFTSGTSSPWHFPKSRDGGSIFNLPDMGGFSSRNRIDDFSTGGGF
jgi:hypothetical protein